MEYFFTPSNCRVTLEQKDWLHLDGIPQYRLRNS